MTAGMPSDSAHVLQSRHGGAAFGLVDPVLSGAVREGAQVGAGADHCLVDAEREHGPGHLVVYCQAPGCRSAWYKPRHEPE
jgi:hypothetical protein